MAENTGGSSFKVGIVSDTKPGFAKVSFPDLDNMPSAWLPLVVKKSLKDKQCFTLDKGEQVACALDENFDGGVVLGAVFSDADTPPVESADKYHLSFSDGGMFEYDRSSGDMKIVCKGHATLTVDGDATVKAASVKLDTPKTTCTGELTVEGKLTVQSDVSVQGDVSATGTVMDGGGNSNHHSH